MSIVARTLVPESARSTKLTRHAAQCVAGSLLMAVCAHVSFPLFFTPVPLTLQTFGVLLIGLTLSPGVAFASLALYLLEGAAGLPVFSPYPHLLGGVAQLFGPTGGYLLSYPAVVALIAVLRRTLARQPLSRFATHTIAACAGTVFFLTAGALWLAVYTHSLAAAWTLAVLPFLPGEAIKIVAAAALTSTGFTARLQR
jgi:biotin transport system substrate-specific component